jgi:hypothetical protein
MYFDPWRLFFPMKLNSLWHEKYFLIKTWSVLQIQPKSLVISAFLYFLSYNLMSEQNKKAKPIQKWIKILYIMATLNENPRENQDHDTDNDNEVLDDNEWYRIFLLIVLIVALLYGGYGYILYCGYTARMGKRSEIITNH